MQENIQMLAEKKIGYFITKSNLGGAQRYVLDLAIKSKNAGADVFVLAGGNGPLGKELEKNNIRHYQINSLERDINFKKELINIREIFKILKSEKPDILHLNSSKSGLVALVGRILRIKKIIFTIHGWAFNEHRGVIEKWLIKILYAITILMCHTSIAVSKTTKQQLTNNRLFNFVEKKLEIIHNGISEFEMLNKTEAQKELGLMTPIQINFNSKDIIIGTLAELHHIKGLKYLISAFEILVKNHPHLKLIILGEGEMRKKLEIVIANKDLQKKVFLPGNIHDAKKYLKAFDIFVLPSISEALPISILEAGLAERPIVASNVGGIPEIIDDQINGLLSEPKNILDLSHKMDILISDKKIRDEYSHKIKQKIQAEFNLDQTFINTTKLYLAK